MAGVQSPSEDDVRLLKPQVRVVVDAFMGDLRASAWCFFLRSAPARSLGDAVQSVVGARTDDQAIAVVQRTATPGGCTWNKCERALRNHLTRGPVPARSAYACAAMFVPMFSVPVVKCPCFALTVVDCS